MILDFNHIGHMIQAFILDSQSTNYLQDIIKPAAIENAV
jgi:hypothetical protein